MKTRQMQALRYVLVSLLLVALAGCLALVVFSLRANKPLVSSVLGNDISFPQCGGAFPAGQSFGVVGVNGGVTTNTNPCLSDQLRWAAGSKGDGIGQPPLQLYVNTANPGGVAGATGWPQSNTDPLGNQSPNPRGRCDGGNTIACAWQYGWNRAAEAVHYRFKPAARAAGVGDEPERYKWWLDVETLNSWRGGSPAALTANRAVLEAMTRYYQGIGIRPGIYSTGYQFGKIAGRPAAKSNLNGLESWLAGGENRRIAQSKCADPPLTRSGRVVMVQYIQGGFDFNYSCL